MKEKLKEQGSKLHALVNNAAISPKKPGGARLNTIETSARRLEDRVPGQFLRTDHAGARPDQRTRRRQRAPSSMSRRSPGSRVHPFAGAAYSTSKAALAALTREMAADFGAARGARQCDLAGRNRNRDPVARHREDHSADSLASARPAGRSGEGDLFPVHRCLELCDGCGTAHQWRPACLTRGCGRETIAAHALKSTDEATGAVAPPIYPSSTYARDENYKPKLRENYIRNGNPTLWHAEDAIAALENGKGCLLFASGMAAITTLLETVPPGGHVVAPDVMYYGTRDWLKILEQRGRIGADTLRCDEARHARGKYQARQDRSRVDRDAAQPDLGRDRHRSRGEGSACGGRDPRGRCDGDRCGHDAALGPRRRYRVPFGDQVSERPFRRAGRRLDHRAN